MSASRKKELRKEQRAAELTEKQQKQQAENKKLKTYSVIFVVAILVVAVAAAAIFGVTTINRTGLIELKTIAATVNDIDINSVLMNYYYVDAVNAEYTQSKNSYGDSAALYASMRGLDYTIPLNEQPYGEDGETTWADYYFDAALNQAKGDIILCSLAKEEGFTLTEQQVEELRFTLDEMHAYLLLSGYTNLDDYYRSVYGNGASEEGYWTYAYNSTLAAAYYEAYADKLTYDDAQLRAYEADKFDDYSGYTYAAYYVSYGSYLEGGTEDENGKIVYSDAEKDAARAKAKEVAEHLCATGSLDALNTAIAALPANAENPLAAAYEYKNVIRASIGATMVDWVTDASRKAGDMAALENTSVEEDNAVNGYYVVLFQGYSDNIRPMGNVRHLLVSYESADGSNIYTDEEKATARATADEILNEWKSGAATEESFIELVKEKSDDTGSASSGGLFENVAPTQGVYVDEFTDWAVDESRQVGDVEIIESQYGCHIMYYVGGSEMTYRDHMISSELKYNDLTEWYGNLISGAEVTKGNTKRIQFDLVIQSLG